MGFQIFLRDVFARHQTRNLCHTTEKCGLHTAAVSAHSLSSHSQPIGMGTIHSGHPPKAPAHLCCGSTTPQPWQVHSLQGEGEVILAGLAVAHQVTGLLA